MSTYSQYDDRLLFQQIATGDEAAFREIFQRYTPQLHPFALDIVKSDAVAKEIIQEVFLKLWLKRDSLTEIEKPSSWLYRITSNLSLNHFRRQQLELRVMETIQTDGGEEEIENNFSAKELQSLIHEASQLLPFQRKKIFMLSREQGLSRKEVAQQLGISENTVRNQLGIALKHIQDYIIKHNGLYIPAFLIVSWGLS